MNINYGEITVVIPVYNGQETIIKTLESICAQSALHYIYEIIVVNDGSIDNTEKIVEKFAASSPISIKVFCKENGGVSSARNRGIELSTTSWIALCDADDIWLPDKILNQVNIINSHEIDLLGGEHREKKKLRILFRTVRTLYQGTVKDLCFTSFPQLSTVLMRKRIFNEIGGFDEIQRYAEDGNYLMKVAAQYRLFYDPVQVICYGDGKRGFGESGLSGNIKGMHYGIFKNLKEMRELNYIGFSTYISAIVYEQFKYLRRIMITKMDSFRKPKKG